MGVGNKQIRVSERVKPKMDRRRREGGSSNGGLERLLAEEEAGNFDDGFGRWSGAEAERARQARRNPNPTR